MFGRTGERENGRTGLQRAALVALLAVTMPLFPFPRSPVLPYHQLQAQTAPPIRQAFPMPAEYRDIQIRAQETQRTLLLSMVDSMPERLFRTAAGVGQRDFAQQIHHAANANQFIVSRYILGWDSVAIKPDTARIFNSRAALHEFVQQTYDFSLRALREESAEDRQRTIWYFGQKMPKWMVWDELNQHTIWTAGQIVANFRAQGMAPPAFMYF